MLMAKLKVESSERLALQQQLLEVQTKSLEMAVEAEKAGEELGELQQER